MCGIALFIEKKNENLKENIRNIIFETKHRGPDDEGFYFENNLALGSNRLSILDLSENGRMPFFDSSGRYKVSFNGEIYNYIELKKQFNITTKTNTDTEVLIELYAKLKEKMLGYLNGIFAFTIYDSETKEIFCARDRFGIKPLYYYISENGLIVSSEIKGIINTEKNLKSINEDTLVNYLKTSFYDVDENTFYKNIFSLQASNYMIYSLSNKNVLRGMHFQVKESAHNKLIQCIQGSILDVCVDIRKKSIFYNKPISIKTSGDSAIYIPKGFAHGFLALEDNTIVQYMADKEHDPINDKGVLWNSLDFIWPIKTPILSDRDKNHPAIGEEECIFL